MNWKCLLKSLAKAFGVVAAICLAFALLFVVLSLIAEYGGVVWAVSFAVLLLTAIATLAFYDTSCDVKRK
jgi:hypothetical protein